MICLDTNVVIAYLRGRPHRVVGRFEGEVLGRSLSLSSIALFELAYGAAKSARPQENSARLAIFLQLPITVLPFETEDADEAGEIRATLERAGTMIGPYDLLIAAQARRRKALLVTANTTEFGRVPGLAVEDWSTG
ncbi:MAG: type II toxin-antitoxin system VapC family toxin [Alphaproteobacteria bacterium]